MKRIISVACSLCFSVTILIAQSPIVNFRLKEAEITNQEIKLQLRKHKKWHEDLGPINACIGSDSTGTYYKRRANVFYPLSQMVVIDKYDTNEHLISQTIITAVRFQEIQHVILLKGKLFAITRTFDHKHGRYRMEAHAIAKDGGPLLHGVLLEEAEIEFTHAPQYKELYTDWSWIEKCMITENNSQLLFVYAKTPEQAKGGTIILSMFDEGLKPVNRYEIHIPGNEIPGLKASKLMPLTRIVIEQLKIGSQGQVWMLLHSVTTLNKKRTHLPAWQVKGTTIMKKHYLLRCDLSNGEYQSIALDMTKGTIVTYKLLLHPNSQLIYVGGSYLLQGTDRISTPGTFLYTLRSKDLSVVNYAEQALSLAKICAAGKMPDKKMPPYYDKKWVLHNELTREIKLQYLKFTPDKKHVIIGLEGFASGIGSDLFSGAESFFIRLLYLDIYLGVFTADGNAGAVYRIPKAQNCILDSYDRSAKDVFASFVLVIQNKNLYVIYNEIGKNINMDKPYAKNNGRAMPFIYDISLINGDFTGNWLDIPELPHGTYISPYFTQLHPDNKWYMCLQKSTFSDEIRFFWGALDLPE